MEQPKYHKVIEPTNKWFDLHLREVWKYRDLVLLFVKREFISKYKQTVLGPAWAIIQPLLTTVVFTFVFGNVAGLAECGAVPAFLFYMCGNVAWQFFAGCLTGTANTFVANSNIMGKVYFPRLVMPISIMLSQLVSFVIQAVMFVMFLVIYLFVPGYEIHITGWALLTPLLILQMGLLGLGCGIIVSALTTKYRDLAMLVTFGVQLWMYATPVAYSMSIFEGSRFYGLLQFNPMTPIINTMRYALLGSDAGSLEWGYFAVGWVVTLVLLGAGVVLFNKVEKTFMDTV